MVHLGKAAGMSDAALAAEETLAIDAVAALTENKCVNASVLITKYGDFCRELEPERRAKCGG